MPRPALLITPAIVLALSGCVAKTIVDVATLPVRAAGQAADWATTSGDERDRARGREIREREERLGELQGDLEELEDDCLDGDDDACREAVEVRREIEVLVPQIPVEPEDD